MVSSRSDQLHGCVSYAMVAWPATVCLGKYQLRHGGLAGSYQARTLVAPWWRGWWRQLLLLLVVVELGWWRWPRKMARVDVAIRSGRVFGVARVDVPI